MIANGGHIRFIGIDERLSASDFDGSQQMLADSVDLLYVASHGEYTSASTYRLILHADEWSVSGLNLGAGGPSVAVFDTCDLLDLNDPQWPTAWRSAGAALRLLLGFASPATVATDSTLRGQVFAEKIVGGDPIGPAWLQAVHATSYAGIDLAVAVGFGDTAEDANWALREMTLADLPTPRGDIPACIEIEVCH